jgi:hypothetical protein
MGIAQGSSIESMRINVVMFAWTCDTNWVVISSKAEIHPASQPPKPIAQNGAPKNRGDER